MPKKRKLDADDSSLLILAAKKPKTQTYMQTVSQYLQPLKNNINFYWNVGSHLFAQASTAIEKMITVPVVTPPVATLTLLPRKYPTRATIQWGEAEKFFASADKTTVKYNKKNNPLLTHSFLKIPDTKEIYKICKEIGQGVEGKIKIVENKTADSFVVKITGGDLDKRKKQELKVMQDQKMLLGTAERKLEKKKNYMEEMVENKIYQIMPRFDMDLHQYLKSMKKENTPLNLTQKLVIALQCALEILAFNDKNYIHTDIKSDNFLVKIYDDRLVLKLTDFGYTRILQAKSRYVKAPEGERFLFTKNYCAPEITQKHKFSFASDLFALGSLFNLDLKLPKKFYEKMLNKQPNQRGSLVEVLALLVENLEGTEHKLTAAQQKIVRQAKKALPPVNDDVAIPKRSKKRTNP